MNARLEQRLKRLENATGIDSNGCPRFIFIRGMTKAEESEEPIRNLTCNDVTLHSMEGESEDDFVCRAKGVFDSALPIGHVGLVFVNSDG